VTVERNIQLPPLTEKDREGVLIGLDLGLRHFALSFANRGEDVDVLRALVGDDAEIISKIESRKGIENLANIARRSEALLIDRGDLSREVPIELIPQTQKSILRHAKRLNTRVYVATNLLESMVHTPAPTRAEVNDIYNTLLDGADGLVLAAETAIGAYPVHCASMISRLIQSYEKGGDTNKLHYPVDPVSLLVEPHGKQLVHREATDKERRDAARLPTLIVSETTLMDCEQLACGTYSPLSGFMDRATLDSVLADYRLPGGEVWPLPILLQVPAADVHGFGVGESVVLQHESGKAIARIDITDVFIFDLDDLTERMYGTQSRDHPGVARILSSGEVFMAGDVTLIEPLPSVYRHYQLTPSQTRFIFTRLGWSRVVGFHGRNPAHRGHEEIQLRALERTGADGLYINPVIGAKRKGDFLPDPIMMSYQTMLEFGCYPKGKVVLGCFSTYPRYAGPREAVFTALCRKNMGCSHFIVGRDHAGVGDFYAPDANQQLFDRIGDIGIEPVFFDAIGYNPETARYDDESCDGSFKISGTEIRETLKSGNHLPDWFMREIVQDVLRSEMASGRPVFYE
jgi:ATP sulfurylase